MQQCQTTQVFGGEEAALRLRPHRAGLPLFRLFVSETAIYVGCAAGVILEYRGGTRRFPARRI
jgi:hypothetical protein